MSEVILPMLRPAHFAGPGPVEIVSFSFSEICDPGNPLLLKIVLGYDEDGLCHYPSSEGEERNESLLSEAFSNLMEDQSLLSEVQQIETEDDTIAFLATGSDYTSSAILIGPLRQKMREDWEIPHGVPLMTAAPARHCALFGYGQSPVTFMNLVRNVYQQFVDDPKLALSPLVHLFSEGDFLGVLPEELD